MTVQEPNLALTHTKRITVYTQKISQSWPEAGVLSVATWVSVPDRAGRQLPEWRTLMYSGAGARRREATATLSDLMIIL